MAALLAIPASAQVIRDPNASLTDISAARTALLKTTDPTLVKANNWSPSCLASSVVAAPARPMVIPNHYLVGNSGAVNPAEAVATAVYNNFEIRITGGVNRWISTGDEREATCALAQMDTWAAGLALYDYTPESSYQAWYQSEWTLSTAGVAMSALAGDKNLDPKVLARVNSWLDSAARRLIGFDGPTVYHNNHYYWRGLAAMSIGIVNKDQLLVAYGIKAYQDAIADIDSRGAFPKEMTRAELCIHYQQYALAPLVEIAQLSLRQGTDLFAYTANGHTLKDAVVFLGNAMANPALILPYTTTPQNLTTYPGDLNPLNFFLTYNGTKGINASITAYTSQVAMPPHTGGDALLFLAK